MNYASFVSAHRQIACAQSTYDVLRALDSTVAHLQLRMRSLRVVWRILNIMLVYLSLPELEATGMKEESIQIPGTRAVHVLNVTQSEYLKTFFKRKIL